MRNLILVGAIASFLSACATVPLETGPRIERVEVPVAVACVAAADVPVMPAPTPINISSATLTQKAAAVGADLLALDRYAKVASAILAGCAQPGPTQ